MNINKMNNINNINNIKITQDPADKYLYTIHFPSYSTTSSLIKSLTKSRIILGATVSHNYNQISFKASSVQSFHQEYPQCPSILAVPLAAKMLHSLTKQLFYLIQNESKTIIGYAPENIIVIDGDKFIYLSSDHLLDIYPQTAAFTVTYPFSHNDFFISPELEKVLELPSHIHYKSSYFSLGCLIIYALSGLKLDDLQINQNTKNNQNTENNQIKNSSNAQYFNELLDTLHIRGTKLYWLLKRTLVEDVNKRSILFI